MEKSDDELQYIQDALLAFQEHMQQLAMIVQVQILVFLTQLFHCLLRCNNLIKS